MTAEIITLDCVTYLDVPVERVLDAAKGRLDGGAVIIIGRDKDGELYFAANKADGGDALWLLEKAKLLLLEVDVP